MQIVNLKISNIDAFPYVQNLNQIKGINFSIQEQGATNIIIGPNGSGKSTILEILNQIIKIGIHQDYVYDKTKLNNITNIKDKNDYPIKKLNHKFHNLSKHYDSNNKPSHFYIKLFLTQQDIINMNFISSNFEKINLYIKKYSGLDIEFFPQNLETIELQNTFSLFGTFDFLGRKIVIRKRNFSELQHFVFKYLRHYELLKIILHIVKKEQGKTSKKDFFCNNIFRTEKFYLNGLNNWGNSFAVLGAKRDFDRELTYRDNFTEKELDIKTHKTDTKSILYGGLGYLLVCKKFRNLIREIGLQNTLKHKYFQELNNIFKQYLNLQLHIKYSQDKVFLFVKKYDNIDNTFNNYQKTSKKDFFSKKNNGHILTFSQLSSGEESFSLLILTVFGYGLYNGTMLIDEPELHLHPQSQKNFLKLLRYLQKKFHTQFILATHSPVFVSIDTIKNTIRLSKTKKGISIYNNNKDITQSEHNLMHMLKYGNIAKMFFVDKIVMVEGETDLYFFSHYLNYLQDTLIRKDKIKNYEIIDIGGKGSFKKRQKLLLKFGIQSYFIGDRDNVLDTAMDSHIYTYKRFLHSNSPELQKYRTRHKTETYGKLIQYIHDKQPRTYTRLLNKIKSLYSQNIFLLQRGDLETYIGLSKKGIGPTVDFCNNIFKYWIFDKKYDIYKKELESLFHKIFG